MGNRDDQTDVIARPHDARLAAVSPGVVGRNDFQACWVVMYHYVHDVRPVDGGPSKEIQQPVRQGLRALTREQFGLQLDDLCRAFEPIDWPTLYAWTCGRASLPRRSVLLTFDDGLADHARIVLPILQERGLRGVFFVPGAVLTSQRLLCAHAIHLLLSRLDEESLERELGRFLSDHGLSAQDCTPRSVAGAQAATYAYESPRRARLKYWLTFVLPRDLRVAAVETLFERHVGSLQRWAREWYLDWDDLADMRELGHTIGGHGFLHEPYLQLTPTERRLDARRTADVLRAGLGPDIRPFSYPYGSFDDDTCLACREAGFVHGFTTRSEPIVTGGDVGRLPRVDARDVGLILREGAGCLPV